MVSIFLGVFFQFFFQFCSKQLIVLVTCFIHAPKCCFQVNITKSEFKANLSVCKIGIYNIFAANADWFRNIFFLFNILVWAFLYIHYILRVSIFLPGIFSGNVHVKSDKITAMWSAMDNDGFNLLPPYIITYVIN